MTSTAGRLPPHDLDAEAVVLCAMLEKRGALDVLLGQLRAEDFYADANAQIFSAASALASSGTPVDVNTVSGWLRDRGQLERVGGTRYLSQIVNETPSVANVEVDADRIRQKARMRHAIATCQRLAAEGYGDVGDIDEWLQGAEAAVARISQETAGEDLVSIRQTIGEVMTRVLNDDGAPKGIQTGLCDLDRILGPMRPGQLVIIAAGSGIGKSALALNIGIDVATRDTRPFQGVIAFSAEMSREELAERALFGAARVDTRLMNDKSRMNKAHWDALTAAAPGIATEAFLIDDRADLSPLQVKATIRKAQAAWRKQGRCEMAIAIVDYVQLLNGKAGLPKDATREAEVNAIGRALKNTAKECGIPIIALAQLNADATKRKDEKPRMSDMRESKALAMHADKIILIHNPHAVERAQAYRNGERGASQDLPPEPVSLIVDKNRGGGRTGTVRVLFFPQYTLFENMSEADARAYGLEDE